MVGPGSPLTVWVDAQLPPVLALWLQDLGEKNAVHVVDLGLLAAEDLEIFEGARQLGAVVLTKDSDFVQLQERYGPPPRVVWITCGNRSNRFLKDLIVRSWPRIKDLLMAGEILIEINDLRESAE